MDKNFNDFAEKFHRNIYESFKGKVRRAIISPPLENFLDSRQEDTISVLDAGCGNAVIARQLLQQYVFKLTVCDISDQLLAQAKQELGPAVHYINAPIQQLDKSHNESYDLILLHAVLEWSDSQMDILRRVKAMLKPKGRLSILYYNENSLRWQHLMKGNWWFLAHTHLKGPGDTLTPINPVKPAQFLAMMNDLGLHIELEQGVRVFSDYMNKSDREKLGEDKLIELELQMSQQQPFCQLARYIHVIVKKD